MLCQACSIVVMGLYADKFVCSCYLHRCSAQGTSCRPMLPLMVFLHSHSIGVHRLIWRWRLEGQVSQRVFIDGLFQRDPVLLYAVYTVE